MKQYILRSANLINLLLMAAVLFLAVNLVSLLSAGTDVVLPKIQAERTRGADAARDTEYPSSPDYAAIAENNLFHFERKIPPAPKDGTPDSRPDIVLYGTLITANAAVAYLEDRKAFLSSPGRGERQRVVKKGEPVGGYILQDIFPDRIVLAKGPDRVVVYLSDRNKKGAPAAKALHAERNPSPMPPLTAPVEMRPVSPGQFRPR